MKYNELHKILRKSGCFLTGNTRAGHPEWYSPITHKTFTPSHHGSEEVREGTRRSILKSAGLLK